jgi:hypothetical protein
MPRQNGGVAESLRPPGTRHVARTYAGILANVGMLVVLFRALKNGAGVDGTILQAVVAMILMAAVGLILGTIADSTVAESVRVSMQTEIDALTNNEQPQPTN